MGAVVTKADPLWGRISTAITRCFSARRRAEFGMRRRRCGDPGADVTVRGVTVGEVRAVRAHGDVPR